jgi:hypothetical protein
MGLNSEIVAIGRFTKAIVPFLEYPPDRYANVREGVTIPVSVFWVETGTSQSCVLAECFGVDLWDFNRHHLDPYRVDVARLRTMFDDDQIEDFLALRAAGFEFFFMPNG